jgi:hypothetical protein
VSPLITVATVSDGEAATDPDELVLTITEPVDPTTGSLIANYDSSATINLAGATPTPDTAGTQVTIEAAADGQFGDVIVGYMCDPAVPATDIAPNNWIAMPGVEDVNGNLGVAAATLSFQVADGIAPRILSAATLAGAINAGAPAVDGLWDVGDGAAVENISFTATFSEPVIWDTDCDGALDAADATALGITAAITEVNAGTYFGLIASIGSVGGNPATLRFDFQITGTALVDVGDSIAVIGVEDTSGNALSGSFDEVELLAATTGYTIN